MTVDQLRERRAELQQLDDAVSYVRRVAQGRADIARDVLERKSDGDDDDTSPDGLRVVLADRLLGGGERPPRPAADFSDHPLSAELDGICADLGFGRLDELALGEVRILVRAIDDFEERVSSQRQAVFAELDALTDELVERYRVDHEPEV